MADKGTIRKKTYKVEFDLKRLSKLVNPRRVVTPKVAKDLVDGIKEESLKLVEVGKSPVKGKGRFKAYAAQRKKGKKKRKKPGLSGLYPETSDIRARYPGKKTRPVNLELRSDKPYLNSLFDYKKISGGVQFFEPKDDFLQMLYTVHNEGARKDIPKRQVVPEDASQDYTASVRKIIKSIYNMRIRDIIKKNG